jgi:hypothetical protein
MSIRKLWDEQNARHTDVTIRVFWNFRPFQCNYFSGQKKRFPTDTLTLLLPGYKKTDTAWKELRPNCQLSFHASLDPEVLSATQLLINCHFSLSGPIFYSPSTTDILFENNHLQH